MFGVCSGACNRLLSLTSVLKLLALRLSVSAEPSSSVIFSTAAIAISVDPPTLMHPNAGIKPSPCPTAPYYPRRRSLTLNGARWRSLGGACCPSCHLLTRGIDIYRLMHQETAAYDAPGNQRHRFYDAPGNHPYDTPENHLYDALGNHRRITL